jgi:hypothetical protein
MAMNEIKKGDWVYAEEGGEHVFQCGGTRDGIIIGGDDWWFTECCHRLDSLKPGDKLDPGDRVAVIDRSLDNDPGLGTIHRVIEFSAEARRLPIIDATQFGWIMEFGQLARLPDCAQDKRSKPEDTENVFMKIRRNLDCESIPYVLNKERCQPSPDDSIWSDTVNPEQIFPCPHPEWEGTWDYLGDGYRVEWKHTRFVTSRIHGTEVVGGWAPGEFWKQIEPAINASTAGPKLERPKKHGGIKTPWDPWEV